MRILQSIVKGEFLLMQITSKSNNKCRNFNTSGFESGFTELDKLTLGFQPGSINIVAVHTPMLGSAFSSNIAQFGGGSSNATVLIFSLEHTSEQLVQRMLAAQAEVSFHAMDTGTMGRSEWDKLTKVSEILTQQPIFIDDSKKLTMADLRERGKHFKEHYPNLGLIVVDYIQLLSFDGQQTDNSQQNVAEISRMLKDLATELACPIIALYQLQHELEEKSTEKPMLSDLQDSGAVEQYADTVMFLYGEFDDEEIQPKRDCELRLTLAKNKNGPTDTIRLIFQRNTTRFRNSINQ